MAGETADRGRWRSLSNRGKHQIYQQRLCSQADPQLGTGQSRGCHGLHRPHDSAHLTHAASRGRADPLHDGLPFNVGRASCPAPPCLWRKAASYRRRHWRPSPGIQVAFCFPLNVFRLCMTYWDKGSQSPQRSHPSHSVFITLSVTTALCPCQDLRRQ